MKFSLPIFLVLLTLIAPASRAGNFPEEVSVPLEKGFVPVGFDDNDNTQVMVAGTFSDTCHKVGPARVQVNSATGEIQIEQLAYRYSDICLRMMVPFVNVIDLGILPAARYKIFDKMGKAEIAAMSVLVAKSSAADDFLYAPVADSDVVASPDGKEHLLTLKGNFTNRCSALKEVIVNRYAETIVVQPIMTYTGEGRDCPYSKVRFQFSVPLKEKLTSAMLLHVRVMNGKAVNKLVDVP